MSIAPDPRSRQYIPKRRQPVYDQDKVELTDEQWFWTGVVMGAKLGILVWLAVFVGFCWWQI